MKVNQKNINHGIIPNRIHEIELRTLAPGFCSIFFVCVASNSGDPVKRARKQCSPKSIMVRELHSLSRDVTKKELDEWKHYVNFRIHNTLSGMNADRYWQSDIFY